MKLWSILSTAWPVDFNKIDRVKSILSPVCTGLEASRFTRMFEGFAGQERQGRVSDNDDYQLFRSLGLYLPNLQI